MPEAYHFQVTFDTEPKAKPLSGLRSVRKVGPSGPTVHTLMGHVDQLQGPGLNGAEL